ncbi:MAG: hypothetical protein HYT71_01995 [Candidatus Aenigmarchaeota archaeon]|nr:hypothetical protein [Candidatus Aenigmarchaeota archaeon]
MIIGNGKMLATVEDSKITKLFWPTVNNFQNMVESRIGIFSFNDNAVSWIDEWKTKQQYVENSNILETTTKKGTAIIHIKDFVLPMENCLLRIISTNEPAMIYCCTKTQLGENQKKDSVIFESGMLHKNKDVALCVFSPNEIKEHDVGEIEMDSLQEKNAGESTSVMSFFTAPDKDGNNKAAIFIAISNSVKDVNKIMTSTLNTDKIFMDTGQRLCRLRFRFSRISLRSCEILFLAEKCNNKAQIPHVRRRNRNK